MPCFKEVTWCGVSQLLRMRYYIVEVSTVGLDSGIVGRANGNSVEML